LAKKIFVLDSTEGEIAPNAEQEIRFTFLHTTDYKLKPDNNSGIVLRVLEHIAKRQISE